MKAYHQSKLLIPLAVLISLSLVGNSRAGEPLEMVKSSVEKAMAILKDPKLKSPEMKSERIERIKTVINPIFDYDEMGRRCLGAHWRRRSPAEQEEFLRLFRVFIEKVYSDRLDFYQGERFVVGRETTDGDYAEIETRMISAKGEESQVIFRLRRADGRWRVYDAVVENISIVQNYRSQFDRVISKSSYDELKKMLKEKAS